MSSEEPQTRDASPGGDTAKPVESPAYEYGARLLEDKPELTAAGFAGALFGEFGIAPEPASEVHDELTGDERGWEGADFTTTSVAYPPALRERDQWMVRGRRLPPKDRDKAPYAPWADEDGTRWGRESNRAGFETAKKWADTDPQVDGLAFIHQETDPFVFVDGDDVRCPEMGDVHPAFRAVLKQLGMTYADVSTSGSGVHAIYRGDLPGDLPEATWQLDAEPWGENDDPPEIELYANNHVNVTTGRHVSSTALRVAEWDRNVLETILEAVGEYDPKPPSDAKTVLEEYDLDEFEPSEWGGVDVTGDIWDLFADLDRLNPKRVAEKTIVREWTRDKRSFLPVWGAKSDNGTANYVNDKIWHDTGHDGGYGGPVVMAAIDGGIVNHAGATPSDVTGDDFFKAVEQLRQLGFDVPLYIPEAGSERPDGEPYEQTPLWALRKAATALGVCERSDFVEHETDDGETYLGFDGPTYNAVLRALDDEGIDHGREPIDTETRSGYYDADLAAYVDGGDPWTDPDTMLRAALRARDDGAVSEYVSPPTMALLPLRRDVLEQEPSREMSSGTKALLEDLFHELTGGELDDVLDE